MSCCPWMVFHRKWPSAMLLLPLFLLWTHHVTSEPPFSLKSPVANVMISMLKIQQVKERILRGLNMTTAPQRSPTTRNLTPESSKVKVKRPQDSVDRQQNVFIIFSESAENERLDTLSFKLDSRIRERIQGIELAVLVVRLGFLTHLSNQTELTDKLANLSQAEGSRGLPRRKQKRVAEFDEAYSLKTLMECAKMASNRTADSVENSSSSINWREHCKDRRGGKGRKSRGQKPWRVKMVVKVVDPDTGKKRRIAVERVSVTRTSTTAVPVSKDVLVSAAESSNHALLLQMTCKRCQGHVQIENVYKTTTRKTRKQKKRTRLNPNRPYLFIKAGNNIASMEPEDPVREVTSERPNEILRTRLKRRSVDKFPINLHSSRDHQIVPRGVASPISCCSQHVQVSFHELGLDFIIYPKTFSIVHCSRSCDSDEGSRHPFSFHGRDSARLKLNYKRWSREIPDCSLDTMFSSNLPDVARMLKATLNIKPWWKSLTSPINSTRDKKCEEIIVRYLDVVYVDGSSKVRTGKVGGVV